jgi:hypothetical protein
MTLTENKPVDTMPAPSQATALASDCLLYIASSPYGLLLILAKLSASLNHLRQFYCLCIASCSYIAHLLLISCSALDRRAGGKQLPLSSATGGNIPTTGWSFVVFLAVKNGSAMPI